MQNKPILGIIGNVGPEADEVLQRLIRLEAMAHGASKDQDFLPMIVVKNPEITDRTLAIFEGGISPAVGIIDSCKILQSCGIYLAALPSNTSHYFKHEYQAGTPVYIIDIIALTVAHINASGATKVGLLATTPTINTGLFATTVHGKDVLAAGNGPVYIAPQADIQEAYVQSAIYGSLDASGRHDRRQSDGLKSGQITLAIARLEVAINRMIEEEGVDTFITGCTEVSIIVDQLREAFPNCTFIDPMECLAKYAYRVAGEVSNILSGIDDIPEIELQAALDDPTLTAAYVAGKIRASLV
ncbi:aspartate/glutamate racemase family protein [Pseudomonas sp. RC10]|uniref:aspartate/glutamate racemase family protein n=1 Tax=Pseudomonas bambusae TaxID=3139142 RepID=UPI0031397AB4